MKLEMIGINHTTSALATRDKAAIGPERLGEVVNTLLKVKDMEGVVVLSTCNRTELYLSPSLHLPDDLRQEIFAKVCRLTPEETQAAYTYKDDEAAHHLFRVASGLDSQLLGEVQILTQVKGAYQVALELASSNAFLNRTFLRAIECGKLVRHRTGISQGAVSVAFAAVELASRVFGHFDKHNVLLVGAGETIKLVAKHLTDAGAKTWRISNRTRANAVALAQILGGTATTFPPSEADLGWADLVVSATSSLEIIIPAERGSRVMKHRKTPMVILDLAVPRDVDPKLAGSDVAYVYGVDDFKELVEANLKARQKEAARAEKLVDKQVAEFMVWANENRIAPTIQQLQEVLEGIRNAEVEANARRFKTEDKDQLEKFSKALMQKVTSLIVANMKRACVDRDDLSLARAVAMAFASADETIVNKVLEKLDHELSH